MTQPVATVLVLLLVALVLFGTEKIPIDVVTILLVIGLVLTGTLNVSEAFAGFGNDIVITIAGLFVLTGGLVKTGVVDVVGMLYMLLLGLRLLPGRGGADSLVEQYGMRQYISEVVVVRDSPLAGQT